MNTVANQTNTVNQQVTNSAMSYKQTTIYKHLDLLEHLIDDAVGVYKYKFINADEFLDVLDKARARLPEELKEASEVLHHRETIIAEANKKGEQIIQNAKRQAEQMLQESEILKAVQAEVERIRKLVITEVEQMRKVALSEAEKIRQDALEDAMATKQGSDYYADSILTRLEADLAVVQQKLNESSSVIQNGKKVLSQGKLTGIANTTTV